MSSVAQLAALVAPERLRPLHRSEFERMVEEGLFADEHVELLRGALVEMSPQGARHAAIIQRLTTRLVPALLGRAEVRIQSPLAVSPESLPEPDLAVVAAGAYDRAHPTTAFLVVEVAETSLNKDRLVKAELYAAAGLPEYWIIDVTGGVIEVHTEPSDGRFTRTRAMGREDVLRPVAFGDVSLVVADILGV